MAKRFRFRLETVLRLRRRAFEEQQRIVAARQAQIARREAAIVAIETEIAAELERSRSTQQAVHIDVAAVRAGRTHVRNLRGRITQLRSEITEHERLLETERAQMIQASIAVKAIEKLKERRLDRHTRDQNRAEDSELNEVSINVFRRSETPAGPSEPAGATPETLSR